MTEQSEVRFQLIEKTDRPAGVRTRVTEVLVPGGPVAHAIDHDGRRHLLIPLAAGDLRLEDHSSRGVTVTVRRLEHDGRDTTYLDVACEVAELRDLFAVVCDELLARLDAAHGHQPAPVCRQVLDRWRELLAAAPTALLGRERLAGLLAELHFLELACGRDPDRAMRAWTGPDSARADFTGQWCSVEVKATTARDQPRVQIHGLGQLDPQPSSELYLYVEQLEPVPTGGDSVPDAVGRLTAGGVAMSALLIQLTSVGYHARDADAYRTVRFRRTRQLLFRATADGFPRLTCHELRGQLNGRIGTVTYGIDLADPESVPGYTTDTAGAVAELLGDGA